MTIKVRIAERAERELAEVKKDAERWRWWLPYLRVARDGAWTCWMDMAQIPFRSQTTDPNELTDALIERFPPAAREGKNERVLAERDRAQRAHQAAENRLMEEVERAERAERELAEAKKDAALGKAFRECAAAESFEDGVAASLHEQGITRLSDAWMAGRQDFIEEVNAAREGKNE